MKREPSIAAKSLRAVGLVITLVAVVTFSTIFYSAAADYEGFTSSLHTGPGGPAINASESWSGSTLLLGMNLTIHNEGMYPVSVEMSCTAQSNGIACNHAQTVLAPGSSSTLAFHMAVANGTEYKSGARRLQGSLNVTVGLEPFGSISFGIDLGKLIGS